MARDGSGKEKVEVQCSLCEEKMDCPKSMAGTSLHLCNFCSESSMPGMSDEEIKAASKRERKLSRYYEDVELLSAHVAAATFEEAHSGAEIKKMGKEEIVEEFYGLGVLYAMDFMLHSIDPEIIRSLRLRTEAAFAIAEAAEKRGVREETTYRLVSALLDHKKPPKELEINGVKINLEETCGLAGNANKGDVAKLPSQAVGEAEKERELENMAGKKREFVDKTRSVMDAYYALCEEYGRKKPEIMEKRLRQLIEKDKEFLDSYLLLYELLKNKRPAEADKILEEAYGMAIKMITDKNGNWPDVLEWGWLENRHVIRTIFNKAISLWVKEDTNGALYLLRKLLKTNPNDNVGARDYILAIRMGMSFEGFERRFNKGGFYDTSLMNWFNKNCKKFPDEFGWWEKESREP